MLSKHSEPETYTTLRTIYGDISPKSPKYHQHEDLVDGCILSSLCLEDKTARPPRKSAPPKTLPESLHHPKESLCLKTDQQIQF